MGLLSWLFGKKRGRSSVIDFTGKTWGQVEAYLKTIKDAKAYTVDKSIMPPCDYIYYNHEKQCFRCHCIIDGADTIWTPKESHKIGNSWGIL